MQKKQESTKDWVNKSFGKTDIAGAEAQTNYDKVNKAQQQQSDKGKEEKNQTVGNTETQISKVKIADTKKKFRRRGEPE